MNLDNIQHIVFTSFQRVWEQGFNIETLIVFLGGIGFAIIFAYSG